MGFPRLHGFDTEIKHPSVRPSIHPSIQTAMSASLSVNKHRFKEYLESIPEGNKDHALALKAAEKAT